MFEGETQEREEISWGSTKPIEREREAEKYFAFEEVFSLTRYLREAQRLSSERSASFGRKRRVIVMGVGFMLMGSPPLRKTGMIENASG